MIQPSALTPTVQHLPTLLRRVQSGELVVPSFQRRIVWKPKQMVDLLKSVYKGFPLGSLLLWKVDDGAIDPGHIMGPPFPSVERHSQRHYVLDGQQRLATLYGALYGDASLPDKYKIAFNLRDESFDYSEVMPEDGAWIYLSDLFSPKNFLAKQRDLSGLDDSDALLDKAIELHASFQEYMIPLVTISDRSIQEVVQIFERINSTGTKLDAVDFMRAVTWSRGFDLNKQIRRMAKAASGKGFSFTSEGLVRVIAVVLEKKPTAEDMMSLRDLDAAALRNGVSVATEVVEQVCDFFTHELHLKSAAFVPYDAQLLVVARLFAASAGKPTKAARKLVAKWFIASTLNEDFQGKADHRVARIVTSVNDLVAGRPHLLKAELTLQIRTLAERRFLGGKALTSGFCILFGPRGARSLVTGDLIPTETYLSQSDPAVFIPLLSRDEVSSALRRPPPSAKVLANMILCSDASEARLVQRLGWRAMLEKSKAQLGTTAYAQALASQFISADALHHLLAERFDRYISFRASTILSFARSIVDPANETP